MPTRRTILARSQAFCERFGLQLPILLAPMSGVSPPALSIAVAQAGGLGSCGALMLEPPAILQWAANVRAGTTGPFQFNLWIPDPPPHRDAAHEARLREFLAKWGPTVPPEAGTTTLPDFAAQCDALLETAPRAISSVMGLFPAPFVAQLKERGIAWIANVSTLAEARAAEEAGADVVAVQGMEAGGHRGSFDAAAAERTMVGLFALLPAVVDAVRVPVVATGGIADARGVAAALVLGASAAQIGTGFLRCPEAGIDPAWADAISKTPPEGTQITRAFSGRAGRGIATEYVRAAAADDAPRPAPYPVQRGLTAAMRTAAQQTHNVQRMQAWAGQSAALARAIPAGELVKELWQGTLDLLGPTI
ncbi:MAG TPA: nitronate monooxygenase [Pirellulales bacterium]|jgi:nitronate monooxygenase